MLAQAIKGISECVSITDLENKVIFVNDAFEKTYGYSKDEIIWKTDKYYPGSPNNPPGINKEIDEGTDKGGWQGELFNRTKDGREFLFIFPLHF